MNDKKVSTGWAPPPPPGFAKKTGYWPDYLTLNVIACTVRNINNTEETLVADSQPDTRSSIVEQLFRLMDGGDAFISEEQKKDFVAEVQELDRLLLLVDSKLNGLISVSQLAALPTKSIVCELIGLSFCIKSLRIFSPPPLAFIKIDQLEHDTCDHIRTICMMLLLELFSYSKMNCNTDHANGKVLLCYFIGLENPSDAYAFCESINKETTAERIEETFMSLERIINFIDQMTESSVDVSVGKIFNGFAHLAVKPEIVEYISKTMDRVCRLFSEIDDDITTKERNLVDHVRSVLVAHSAAYREKWEKASSNQYKNVDEVLAALDRLVGLDQVKQEVRNLVNFVTVQRQRGDASKSMGYHMVFSGNPGTGKTTVARLAGDLFRVLGILKRGHLVECDRAALVGEFIGQTAIKTTTVIDQSLDGILFIDEAYTLAEGGEGDYGQEAIDTLLKRMEDDRNRLIVIVAGYTDKISGFLASNPGLESRFNTKLDFQDYGPEALLGIFERLCKKGSHIIADELRAKLPTYFQQVYAQRDPKTFGNGRQVRNLYEAMLKRQATRLIQENRTLPDDLNTFNLADLASEYPLDQPGQEAQYQAALTELQELIGLDNVKERAQGLANFVRLQQMRQARGSVAVPINLHSVFTGKPGTGKTTVARLMGRVYKGLGLLNKGHVIECDRSALVAEYVGQTAVKTNSIIDKALDGILFIDEAYMLAKGGGNDFGQEAIDTLLKRMEDDRGRLIVIVAGYKGEMDALIETNPGLKSRFTQYFDFEDFEPTELLKILMGLAQKNGLRVSPSLGGNLLRHFKDVYEARDESFGNARLVRNVFEHLLQQQANRLMSTAAPQAEDLDVLHEADFASTLAGTSN